MVEFVEECIAKAYRHESKMTPVSMSIASFTGTKVRHLLNNLGGMPDCNYLEIGVHKGGTFVSANYENNLNSFAVDNWSEFTGDGARQQFLDNTSFFSFHFLEKDCWNLTKGDIPVPINFYFYDGYHSEECQEWALTKMQEFLASEFVFLVDDYSWDRVKMGTISGLWKTGLKVIYEREIYTPEGEPPEDHWWNGVYLAVLRKAPILL